jgi:transcriptional regulator GlxA family with amidase domain
MRRCWALAARRGRRQRLDDVGVHRVAASGGGRPLKGRRATHWLAMDQLAGLGTVPAAGRVVTDGKYMTAAGVSAGLDMALAFSGSRSPSIKCQRPSTSTR